MISERYVDEFATQLSPLLEGKSIEAKQGIIREEVARLLNTEPLIDPKELADKLKLKTSWVYGMTRKKGPDKIPHLKCGKYYRFRLSAVLAWLEGK